MLKTRIIDAAAICAIGDTKESIRRNLLHPTESHLIKSDQYLPDSSCLVGEVKFDLPPCPVSLQVYNSKFTRLILHLYQQLKPSIDILLKSHSPDRIGIIIGSSTAGVDESEQAFIDKGSGKELPPYFKYYHQEIGAGSFVLAQILGITGPAYTISTACSSSAKVFITGDMLLQSGICDAVIVGGVDSLCKMTVRGFKSLDLLSDSIANPMSVNRNGLNIGEGGALFILKKAHDGVSLLGYGESSDAYHISSPHPEAQGAIAAIRQAVEMAQKDFGKVSYVNLHGTGTVFNDSMESIAISSTVGNNVPCSSTKPLTGHLLGASGAIEAFFCWLILNSASEESVLPPHLWDGEHDPAIPSVSLVPMHMTVPLEKDSFILSTSFAFGGSNCCLAFGN